MNNKTAIVQDTHRDSIDRCNCLKCRGTAATPRVCFNSRKLASRAAGRALTATAGLLLLLNCFLLPEQASASIAASGQVNRPSVGYLQVFSSTEQSQWGEGGYYFLHTGYRIYDSSGKVVKWVENHDNSIDENPQKVEVAPGAYTIWAQSDQAGYVRVPVVVKPYQLAAIHLESDRRSDLQAINPANAVTTSTGRIVGWKA